MKRGAAAHQLPAGDGVRSRSPVRQRLATAEDRDEDRGGHTNGSNGAPASPVRQRRVDAGRHANGGSAGGRDGGRAGGRDGGGLLQLPLQQGRLVESGEQLRLAELEQQLEKKDAELIKLCSERDVLVSLSSSLFRSLSCARASLCRCSSFFLSCARARARALSLSLSFSLSLSLSLFLSLALSHSLCLL